MYEYTERISYSKLAPDGNASICTILDLFQDCSIFDSEECGVSLKYMTDHKLIWALSFWQIVIDRFPTLNDVVTAERKLHLTGEPEVLESFKIMPHNLDTNRHVNNGQFVRLAADYIPDGTEVSEIRAEYHMQAHIGDIFVPHVFREKNSLGVSLRNPEGKSYCDVLFLTRY